MESEELKARIYKTNKKVQKKTATIAKKEKLIASGKKNEYEIRWLRDDIRRLTSEIAATQKTIEKYERQLANEVERERIFLTEIPDSMKSLSDELVDRWNKFDFDRRNRLKDKYQELGYREFLKKHRRMDYEFMQLNDADIIEANKKDAKALIIDLYRRINHITGEVTGWSTLLCSGVALNGTVTGKEGIAEVKTILAGGYNIQKLHIRVLVHEK